MRSLPNDKLALSADGEGSAMTATCSKCKRQPARLGRRTCAPCGQKAVVQVRQNQERKIAKGICRWSRCKERFVAGRTMCRAHLDGMLARTNRMRQARLAQGQCVQCGRPSELGQARCLVHRKVREGSSIPPLPVRQALADYRMQQIKAKRKEAEQAQSAFITHHLHLITNPRTRTILQLRYGERLTLLQVGARLGITRERVRQLQQAAEDCILMFTIEKDVPIPVRGTGQAAQIRDTLKTLEVGDSFVVVENKYTTATVCQVAKSLGLVVTTRKVSAGERRVWLVSKSATQMKQAG